jgi:hypothetical protein
MGLRLVFHIDDLPVSVNKLYRAAFGGKVLTDAGKKFVSNFVASRGGLTPTQLMGIEVDPTQKLDLRIWVWMPYNMLINPTYGRRKNTKHYFKQRDASNLVKLPEDCIAALLGVDDRHNWRVTVEKRVSPDDSIRLGALLQEFVEEPIPPELDVP